jgi:alkanesulfonate monooxygenase SsuD/methylene tetrahydromethanopterin reductase-like flavin-dependent oxidoreductase (luciferase family)
MSDGSARGTGLAIPVGVNLTTIGVSMRWWLESAQRVEAAGFPTVWAWDHFVSRGRLSDPLLECWTTLAATAATTSRVRLGSFVTNVVNRHPAVLARMAMTVADLAPGRVELGIGIGGHPAEHLSYGIDFPDARERVARLEEAIIVIRALFSGGPVDFEGTYFELTDAYAAPVPDPAPRILVAGETPMGATLAARMGDAWITFDTFFDKLLPVYLDALTAAGRRRSDVSIVVATDVPRGASAVEAPILADPVGTTARWRERGADELVLHWIHADQLDHVLAAGERAWA